jgi:hypothetical protein
MAGFYALTAPTSDHPPGRSRLYGLIVPTPRLAVESANQRSARTEGCAVLEHLRLLALWPDQATAVRKVLACRRDLWHRRTERELDGSGGSQGRQYLDTQPFSRDGHLIAQLEFDGFTSTEAEYGVRQVGLG